MPQFDAIIIPGGGVRAGGVLPSWVRCRLDRALQRYKGDYMITLSAGTTHRPPPIDDAGFPIFESAAAARYLLAAGVPADRILSECASYETIGNAYFSRVIHVDARRFRRLLVITSDWHLARTEAAFQWVYGLEPKSATYDLSFEGVPDAEMQDDVFRARSEKERKSLQELLQTAATITTISDFHRWFFTTHEAYNAERGAFGGGRVAGAALESY